MGNSRLDPSRMTDEERRSTTTLRQDLPQEQRAIFKDALRALNAANIPYVIEGAFLLYDLTGIWRATKDLDVFVPPSIVPATLQALEGSGFSTSMADPAWLAKAYKDGCLVDIVFGAGNREVKVDELWRARARPGWLEDVPVWFCPPEESLAFKAYVVERHRFDGPDVAHILEGLRGQLDWDHLLWRMGDDWELLFFHLLLFRYIYPLHAHYIPREVMDLMTDRLVAQLESPVPPRVPFRGSLIAPFSFNADVERGFPDPRAVPPAPSGASGPTADHRAALAGRRGRRRARKDAHAAERQPAADAGVRGEETNPIAGDVGPAAASADSSQ